MEKGTERIGMEASCTSIMEIQQALAMGDLSLSQSETQRNYLKTLEMRLEKVRGLSGQYGEIDFSPEVRAILKDSKDYQEGSGKYRSKVLVS